MDAIVAQGIKASGHRGIFDPAGHDDALGTFVLTRLLMRKCRIADEDYRKALARPVAFHTRMTDLVSGRPARCLSNRFTGMSDSVGIPQVPDYPIAYDAGKALNKAARNCGGSGFGAYRAG
ncbi:hypothetical protein GL297_14965 [Komagataeibacter sp. FXV2]|nr:hypothetical protein [Komagataeibacter sp. FXV2]